VVERVLDSDVDAAFDLRTGEPMAAGNAWLGHMMLAPVGL
jgi:hypothetical protein